MATKVTLTSAVRLIRKFSGTGKLDRRPGGTGDTPRSAGIAVTHHSFVRRRPERGASAVEFALVLPVLFLIIGAIIDFGFIFAQQISFNTSARDAARAGVLPTVAGSKQTCAQVANRARLAASSGAVGAA